MLRTGLQGQARPSQPAREDDQLVTGDLGKAALRQGDRMKPGSFHAVTCHTGPGTSTQDVREDYTWSLLNFCHLGDGGGSVTCSQC